MRSPRGREDSARLPTRVREFGVEGRRGWVRCRHAAMAGRWPPLRWQLLSAPPFKSSRHVMSKARQRGLLLLDVLLPTVERLPVLLQPRPFPRVWAAGRPPNLSACLTYCGALLWGAGCRPEGPETWLGKELGNNPWCYTTMRMATTHVICCIQGIPHCNCGVASTC